MVILPEKLDDSVKLASCEEKLADYNVNMHSILVIISGIVYFLLVSFITFWIVVFSAGEGVNAILLSDGFLYGGCIVFTVAVLASWGYFSFFKFPQKTLFIIHSSAVAIFILIFFIQLSLIRENQKILLSVYQDFFISVRKGDYQNAYEITTPGYRQYHSINDFEGDVAYLDELDILRDINTIYAIEYSAWSDSGYIITNPNLFPSVWKRPTTSPILLFEKINGRWYFTGEWAYLLIDL